MNEYTAALRGQILRFSLAKMQSFALQGEVVRSFATLSHGSSPAGGSHPHRSKMQPMPKSLVLQGFFGFLGHFFDLSFFATFSEPYGLEPATFYLPLNQSFIKTTEIEQSGYCIIIIYML